MLEQRLRDTAMRLLDTQLPGVLNRSYTEPSSVAEFVGLWPQYRKTYIENVLELGKKVERLDTLAYAMVLLERKFGKQPDYGLEQAIQDVAKEAVEQKQNLVSLQHLSYLGVLYEETYGRSPRIVLPDALADQLKRAYVDVVIYVNRKRYLKKERVLKRLQEGQRAFGFDTDKVPGWLLAPTRQQRNTQNL